MLTPFDRNAHQISVRKLIQRVEPDGQYIDYMNELRDLKDHPGKLRKPSYWHKMALLNLKDGQILKVIEKIATAIDYNRDHRATGFARRYIERNAHIWVELAIPALPRWDHAQLTRSLSAWEKMEVSPGLLFFEKWKKAALSPEIIWDKQDIKRLEDANMFFQLGLDERTCKPKPDSFIPHRAPSAAHPT